VILELPIPPSVNHCWGHSRFGAYRKTAYKNWLMEAALAANQHKMQAIPGTISVAVEVIPGQGWNIKRDIDNVLKCTLDFLGNSGLIDGDDCRTLQRLAVSVGRPETNACLRINIEPIKNPVIIQTKAEAKRAASAVSRGRAKAKKVEALEASTTQPVENEPRDSFFYSLDELREIAREAKGRGKAMARKLSEECDSCR
jgi:crossover junction endodeoxyribonuclease RusA